ncbi:MAG: hypothetical protein DDT30_01468 [Dehalococcoidia bacterium]|nr:hypothetical protein [Bacillota bacterium]MBT9143367.1 hypothetical protein [Bacillota bacterium]
MNVNPILNALREGNPPEDGGILERISACRETLHDFLGEHYLDKYIRDGGSKVKFLIGPEGCGKTHQLLLLAHSAKQKGYLTAYIDARETKLQYIDALYKCIASSIDFDVLVTRYCEGVIRGLGYPPDSMPEDIKFMEWVTQPPQGRDLGTIKKDAQKELEKLFHNRRIDGSFATAFLQLCNNQLGIVSLSEENREVLLRWMKGDSALDSLRQLERLQIFTRIDRYNARNMLLSILEIARLVGLRGLLVCLDCVEDIVVGKKPETGRPKYARAARDDAYEGFRELIDDVDSLERIMFIIAARPELIEDDRNGIRSYDALWLRIQDEIVCEQPNKFADLLHLDRVVSLSQAELADLATRLLDLRLELSPDSDMPPIEASTLVVEVLSHPSLVSPLRRVVRAAMTSSYDKEGGNDE